MARKPAQPTEKTVPVQLTPWKPGQSGNPAGRPKGSRNKLAEAFLADLHEKWQEHGVSAIEAMIADKPGDFVKVVASVMPKELHVKDDSLADLSDEQIMDFLDTVRALAPAGAVKKATGRTSRTEH